MRNGTCILCGKVGNLTGEHIVPAWLGRITKVDFPSTLHRIRIPHLKINSRIYSVPRGGSINEKLDVLCDGCNSQFSSQLQSRAQNILKPFLMGEWQGLSNDQRIRVAQWFQCFNIVRQFQSPELATFSERERHNFRKSLAIPDGTEIWILPINNPDNISKNWLRSMGAPKDSLDTYILVCIFGKAAFIAYGSRSNDYDQGRLAVVEVLKNTMARQVWPLGSKFSARKPAVALAAANCDNIIPDLTRVWAEANEVEPPYDFAVNR